MKTRWRVALTAVATALAGWVVWVASAEMVLWEENLRVVSLVPVVIAGAGLVWWVWWESARPWRFEWAVVRRSVVVWGVAIAVGLLFMGFIHGWS